MALPLSWLDVSPELTSTKIHLGDHGSVATAVVMECYQMLMPSSSLLTRVVPVMFDNPFPIFLLIYSHLVLAFSLYNSFH